ncbi:MAG TPA: DUF2071 domain-containing protein [Candidatus Didemnitutus sp.]|nr:DUF2071 domain-containing protein [Candidatus Didemnitutus sp.]
MAGGDLISHPSLAQVSHRPWPLPASRWNWRQQWRQLAFVHYRVDVKALARLLPADVTIQEYDGSAWVGVVPFRMKDVMRGSWPSVYPLRDFPELNVRTYVEREGRPGVWFISLDADCWPMVVGGRFFYGLPYHRAKMRHRWVGDRFDFASDRISKPAIFRAQYAPKGPVYVAEPGTFAHWIAERYCFYARGNSGVYALDVHHLPWPLQDAEVEVQQSTLFESMGLPADQRCPVCHYSAGVEVIAFPRG